MPPQPLVTPLCRIVSTNRKNELDAGTSVKLSPTCSVHVWVVFDGLTVSRIVLSQWVRGRVVAVARTV